MDTKQKLGELGEFGLIRQIQQQAGSAEHLVKGIGDDCAVQVQAAGYQLLTSTDLLVEGVHFDLRWTGMEQLGRKAVAVNISDIAAMGGTPQSLFLAVAAPPTLSVADLQQFTRGFLAEAQGYQTTLAGGDTCRSSGPLLISVTVQGVVAEGRALYRSGAKPGDAIYVSGQLGDSALALQLLLQGATPEKELADRHHTPRARVALGRLLAEQQLASAMLDVSDGLLADLGHILEESQVAAEVELDQLPLSATFQQHLQQDSQLLELALSGGEDYELLFTSPRQDLAERTDLPEPIRKIGTINAGQGLSCRRADGSIYQPERGGFDHFS